MDDTEYITQLPCSLSLQEWKPLENYPEYEVSSFGLIASHKRGKRRLLRPWHDSNGHQQVGLYDGQGKKGTFMLHVLILTAFFPSRLPCHKALHRDDNKENNTLGNLYWGSLHENAADAKRNGRQKIHSGEDHGMAKLTEVMVKTIYQRTSAGESLQKIAIEFGVHKSCIQAIKAKKTWRHLWS